MEMRSTLLLIPFLVGWANARAQVDTLAMRYAATITEAGLRAHLEVLASDAYEGRETGQKGQKMAAAYIMEQFRKDGIPAIPGAKDRGLMEDGFQQQYPLYISKPGGLSIAVDGKEFRFMRDYLYFTDELSTELQAAEVMVTTPVAMGGMRLGGGSGVVMLLGQEAGDPDLFATMHLATKALEKTGTRVLFMVNDSLQGMMRKYGPLVAQGRMKLGKPEAKEPGKAMQVILIAPAMAEAILDHGHLTMSKARKIAEKKRVIVKVPIKFTVQAESMELSGENVLGYVEGSGKKGELVVVTAHYDHVGMSNGEVYNGADDDGSGTVAVLEMAKAFARAKAEGHGPLRSMLFMTVSGEEKGLLGSEWYTDHPVFPLDSTVADLNIDMIGRVDTVHGDSSKYVYVIGSRRISSQLGELVERQNALYTHLALDYTFDADNDPNRFYYRSDHYNFAKHGVPVAFFFNGVHADYHGPHDEVDKIRFDLLRQRVLLVFHTAWALANSPERPLTDRPVKH